jgi:hypothetical protein
VTSAAELAATIAGTSLSMAQDIAQAYAGGAMNSLVVITRQSGFNTATGEYNSPGANPTVIYDDAETAGAGAKAGVMPTSGPVQMSFADEPEYYDNITVMIPEHACSPKIDDIVQVINGPDDDIIGRYFRVLGVGVGGRITPSVRLTCTGIAPSKQWSP